MKDTIQSFDNHLIPFEITGNGKPLVLLHGIGMSGKVWQNQAEGLSDQFTVICVDLRGHGRCEDDVRDFSISAQARDINALLEGLDLNDVFLTGWSMGSAVAFRYLQDFSRKKRVERLGLVGAGIDFRMRGNQRREFQQWKDLLNTDNPDWPKLFAAGCLTGSSSPETRQFLERIARETGNTIILKSAECLAEEVFTDLLPVLDIPVLICCGRHESERAVRVAQELDQAISCSRLVFFEQSGHSPFLQEAEKFNREVLDFGLHSF